MGLLVAVLAVGPVIGGAQRWLPVAGFSFQPSEVAKVAVVLVLAYLLEKKHRLLTASATSWFPWCSSLVCSAVS